MSQTHDPSTGTLTETENSFAAVAGAIRQRRTVKQFLPKPVPRLLITQLIELAVWAPNHRMTEPWRFYVLDGDARLRLGEIAAEITASKITASGGDASLATRKGAEAAATWANVPVLLYITTQRSDNPEIDEENYGAVCCAIQNLTLAAHVAGLGTSWSSGAVAAAPALHTLVGAAANERMVGLLRLGYLDPAQTPPPARRTAGADLTTWLDTPGPDALG